VTVVDVGAALEPRILVASVRPTAAGESDAAWRPLHTIGGVAAALSAALTVTHAAVFAAAGLPGTVLGWFALFGRSPLLGLLAFELLMVLYVLLSVPVVLALWAALRPADPGLMALYAALSLLGAVAFVAARPAFEMLLLSDGYAAATNDAQRSAYLAAGEATLAVFHGTAFYTSYALGSVTGLIVAAVMLRSAVFGRPTAYLRAASSVLDLGLFLPVVGLFVSLLSVLCLLAFNVLVARRLLQLGRGTAAAGRPRP
jgi:hypothetical protein